MKLLAIIKLTLAELRHSKLIVLPLTVVVALILVAANIENAALHGSKLIDGAWAGLGVIGVLVAVLAASSAISSEIERGTMLLLAARPVSRLTILGGKAIGIGLYLLACAGLWAVTLALTLGTQVDLGAGATFAGGLLVFAPMLLAAMLALTASTVLPSRGAIGSTLAIWGAVAIVASIPLSAVRPANQDRVELAQSILGWVLPTERLADLRDSALSLSVSADSYAALLVIAAWFLAAGTIFATRRSLAR